jgi:hypothetical protein
VGAFGENAKFTGQLHLKLVLAASSLLGSAKKKGEQMERDKEAERLSRLAALERSADKRARAMDVRRDADAPGESTRSSPETPKRG